MCAIYPMKGSGQFEEAELDQYALFQKSFVLMYGIVIATNVWYCNSKNYPSLETCCNGA